MVGHSNEVTRKAQKIREKREKEKVMFHKDLLLDF
jgi:hypothetical protein